MSFIFPLFFIEIVGIFFMTVLIKKKRYDYSIPELLSLSFFLGMVFISFQTLFFYLCGIDLDLANSVAVPSIMLLLVIARYAGRPERLKEFKRRSITDKWTVLEKILVLGIVLQLFWTVFLVFPTPIHSHDAVANYAMKAKMMYTFGNIPQGFFSLSEATVSHPDYPPLLPFLLNWIYSFTGFNDLTANMIMPVIFLAFLTLFYSLLKKTLKRIHALLIVFLFATIPQVYDYATIIHADLILTAFITAALAYFISYIRTGNRIEALLSFFLFGGSLWIKNEAIVFTGAFILIFIAYFFKCQKDEKRRVSRDLISGIILIAVLAAPWFFVKACQSVPNSDMDLSALTPAHFLQNVKDIPIILDLFQQEVFGPKKWNIFWILIFACAVWKRKALWKNDIFYVTAFILLAAAGYFAGYMLTTGNNLFFYVNTTISRFMLHFTGIAMLLLAGLCGDDWTSNL
ncbi:MAG: glycosyltransferase family 39 protein [Candidatus Omnitrophota bacterium]